MSTNQLPETLANVPDEKDLHKIAGSVGTNWEMLAPYLLKSNPMTKVEHIKNDERGSVGQIFHLLFKWRQEAAPDTSFGHLFHRMLQAGTTVTVEWRTIAKDLNIKERDIKACKDGYQRPEQKNRTKKADASTSELAYRRPKEACIFDGRLIELGQEDIDDLDNNYTIKIGDGAIGKVFKSDSESFGFGMEIAVKKIALGEDAVSKSIRREMRTSRILHPFILPLLAVAEYPNRKPEVWFVSPLFKKGDLREAIQNDMMGTVKMNGMTRVKILLHIALAIQYIHTKVPNVRDVIFHKDISSKNVVLDDSYNARLIDFGLAREKEAQTTSETGTMYYTHPDSGTGKSYTESWDYYMFAVIIREMLTGLGPEGQDKKFLKFMEANEVLGKIEERVWLTTSRARRLNDIATQCMQQSEWTVSEFNTNVVEKIKDIWKDFGLSKILDVPDDDPKCHICMINPKAKYTSMTQKHAPNCRQKIEVCIACEKNSFLNPITCYCGTKLTPVIGSRCGALLVAGNDTDDKSLAKALAKDIEELKSLITSHAPRVMGISENNVRTVLPSIPDKADNAKPGKESEQLWPKVKEHIKFFSEGTEVETLLIYFSCHGANNVGTGDVETKNAFQLGSTSDTITLAEFEKELDSLGNIDKLIIILDRCYPPMIRFKSRDRQFIQINACAVTKMADIIDTGSVFTKYLIQGLKANSERRRCSNSCQHCDSYWSNRSDFISVSSLFDYVSNHMKKNKSPQPVFQMLTDFRNIAFYTDEAVIITFTCGKEKKGVPLEYLRTMKQLEDKLSEMFKQDIRTTRVRIQRDTYRKDSRFVDCDTLEKVMSAWVHRQPLTVTFESFQA